MKVGILYLTFFAKVSASLRAERLAVTTGAENGIPLREFYVKKVDMEQKPGERIDGSGRIIRAGTSESTFYLSNKRTIKIKGKETNIPANYDYFKD